MTYHAAIGARAVDAMVRFPKTHGPDATLAEVRAFFADDHVHMALVVAGDGLLVSTIERSDLEPGTPESTPAGELGTLTGRTARPGDPLAAIGVALRRQRRRRQAVIDDSGRLLGLLCLTRSGTGWCSDSGIREREQSRECQ